MKRIYFAIFLLIGFLHPLTSQGNWTGINNNKPSEADITLVSGSVSGTTIHFSLDGFNQLPVRTDRGTQIIIGTPGGVGITEKGMPDLGKLFTDIIIPDAEKMEINIISSTYKEYQDIEVAPSKGHFTRDINPQDVPYEYGEVYEQDAFWPGSLAALEDPYIMRDFRGQTVSVFPFQYNPFTKTLRVYTDIVIEVKPTGEQGENVFNRQKELSKLDTEFRQIYNRHFLNMNNFENKYIVEEEGSMLIIAYDDFAEAMQPFVDWKRKTGRKTILVNKSEAGNTAAAIKSFVENYYAENEDFTYLLLVGDAPQIPASNTSHGYSDNDYGFLEGSDYYNEIFVGRFSAENVSHVETQVQRMIHYERDVNESDTWLSTGMGIARNEGAGSGHFGESDYEHMDFIRDTLLNFTYDEVYRDYDGGVPGTPNTSAAIMSGHFNEGVSIVNFCNHGSETSWSVGGFSNTHVNALTNTGKLPFIWSVACVNGAFVNTYCFAEAWMRATHEGEPTGAIGTLMSTINQAWQPPQYAQDEMVTILAEKRDHIKRTFGGLSVNGSMYMVSANLSQGVQTHVTWVLFGDPSLQVRTAAPQAVSASYDPVILIGASSFDITVDVPDGAIVALSRYDETEGQVVIIGTAVVNGGMASVEFDQALDQPCSLSLVITGFNLMTFVDDEIQVIPPDGPYVTFDHFIIGDTQGNGNNQADYGETINLDLSLKNVGIEPAQGVNAVLSTESEFITISQNSAAWGDIADDASLLVEDAFTFEVSDVIPDNHTVIFTLTITGEDDNEWSSNFSMKIYSPQFTIGNYILDDGEEGNGRLDPGETANLIVRYSNTGGAPAMAPVTSLSATNPYFTISEETIEPGMIASGEFADVEYTVIAHEAAMEGTFVDLLFSIEDGHYFSLESTIVIGQVPEQIIGEGETQSVYYPFYNWYKGNRSQMLYLNEELGAGEKLITELGFIITQYSTSQNNLPNFTINIKHVNFEQVSNNYIDMTDATEVFSADAYQMPQELGLHTWDIEDFMYDGESNLVVEVIWGLLPNYINEHYKVQSTTMGTPMVAYGYSDTETVPLYDGNSSIRPNLFLAFAGEDPGDSQQVTFIVTDTSNQLLENAGIKIGSLTQTTDDLGQTIFNLLPGTFFYDAMAEGQDPILNQEFLVEDQPLTIEVTFAALMNVLFNITDTLGNTIDDAIITFEGDEMQAGEYLCEDLPAGTYNYVVNREHFFEYSGSVELIDQDVEVNISLISDPTGIAELNGLDFKVFPNPTRDQFFVSLDNFSGEVTLTLLNHKGQLIKEKSVNLSGETTISFNLNENSPGVYFLRINDKDSTRTEKIVLQ